MPKSNLLAVTSITPDHFDINQLSHQRFKVYTAKQLDQIPQLQQLSAEQRFEMQEHLKEKGISTGIHYPVPLPFLKAYEYLGYNAEDFPVSYSYKDQILSLF